MLDLILKNGTIVDGSGGPRYEADVGISQGRIVRIGKGLGEAKRILDVKGLVVAPGFIDPHTHYDAQICWDPGITPSSWNGVTTVIMGNCGVGVAPCRPEMREQVASDLANIESIPMETLKQGVTWEWTTFPEYMAAAARRKSKINLGFLVPLAPARQFVMGATAGERAATEAETAGIAKLLEEAMRAGAMGYSVSLFPQHLVAYGKPLNSMLASQDEFRAYSRVLKSVGRGVAELALTEGPGMLAPKEHALLDLLLNESGRPVTWAFLLTREDKPGSCLSTLEEADGLIRRGALPQISVKPLLIGIDLRKPFVLGALPVWRQAFNKSVAEQIALYRSQGFRAEFRENIKTALVFTGRWDAIEVQNVGSDALARYRNRTVAEIAKERRADPLDTFLDLAIEDALELEYTLPLFNTGDEELAKLLNDSRTLIGLADGGAHVDLMCDSGYGTFFLATWVRERKIMSLEAGVRRLTSEPAKLFGIADRGLVREGLAADLLVFDPDRVGSPKKGELQRDLPGGARRLVVKSTGLRYTFVNGELIAEDGELTSAMPGQVVRPS